MSSEQSPRAHIIRWVPQATMVGVILVGTVLRLFALDRIPPGLSHDEAYIGITALEVWLQGRRDIFFEIYNGIEPLIVYWQALYLRFLGIWPIAMRLVNVTAGILTIPLTYAFSYRLLASDDRKMANNTAVLAALGISISFWAIFVSRLALRAVTLPLLELPALYFLWRGFSASSRPSTLQRWAYFALGGIFLGAAMYSYLSSRFLPFIPLLFFAYCLLRGYVQRWHWIGIIIFMSCWALVFTPLGLYYLGHPEVFGQRAGQVLTLPMALAGDPQPLFTSMARTVGGFVALGPGSSRYFLANKPIFEPVGSAFFLLGLLVALNRLRRPPREAIPYALLLIWWVIMLVPDMITGESPHHLRMIGALPVSYIIWALGIVCTGSWLTKWLKAKSNNTTLTRYAWPALLASYLVFAGGLTIRDYFLRWANDAEARQIYGAEFTQVADYLDTSKLDGPVVLSSGHYRDWDRFRLDLQMNHHPPFVIWFHGPQTLLLPPAGSGLDPIYIVAHSGPLHPYWLDFLQTEYQAQDMDVYRLRSQQPDPPLQPLNAVFTDRFFDDGPVQPIVQLQGYSFDDAQVLTGEALPILLSWQPLVDVPGDPDYAFFVHLLDERGYIWAQVDANGYAVVDWQPGVQVLQWLVLPLPPDLPPLEYQMVVGLEDRAGGKSLSLQEQPNSSRVTVGSLTPKLNLVPGNDNDYQIPNATRLEVGDSFILQGYSLPDRFLQPGGTVHVSLYWATTKVPGSDYWLDIWLVDSQGNRLPIDSRQPLDGDFPTRQWQEGQWVRDRFDLTLPPQLAGGIYQLYANWRDETGHYLTPPDDEGIPLGDIFVEED